MCPQVGEMNTQEPWNSKSDDGIGQGGVFVNYYKHVLDSKRRLTIPAEWRELVGQPSTLYVLPGVHDCCLTVLPAREMLKRLSESRQRLKLSDQKARQFNRILASRADLVTWDTAGRIRVKEALLEYARIVSHAVLVGAFEGFELWNPDLWQASGALDQKQFADVAGYVGL